MIILIILIAVFVQLILMLIDSLVFGVIMMLLWNWLSPTLSLPVLTYLQAVAIMFVARMVIPYNTGEIKI